jgi:TRAP-type C4-dicarboxylate transport system permease small subunit
MADQVMNLTFPEFFSLWMNLFMLIIVLIVIALLYIAAWILMIVDVSKRKKLKHADKSMWILILILTGPIGMILYYFMEVRK